jgi:hypothetical protein
MTQTIDSFVIIKYPNARVVAATNVSGQRAEGTPGAKRALRHISLSHSNLRVAPE